MFQQPSHSLIDLFAAHQAVLSQIVGQHPQHLATTDPAAFNEADHHPHMLEYRRPGSGRADFGSAGAGLRSQGLRWRGLRAWATSALIEVALLPFAPWITVVGDTTPNGLRSAMGFPTTKGAPHFVALHGVARMRHKENAAPPTTSPAASQVRLGAQNRSQNKIVFQHQGRYRALTIPVRPKFKMFRNRYCKKQKLRLRMLMLDLMPPSYRTGAQVSSRWDGVLAGMGGLANHALIQPSPSIPLPGKKKTRHQIKAPGCSIYLSRTWSI